MVFGVCVRSSNLISCCLSLVAGVSRGRGDPGGDRVDEQRVSRPRWSEWTNAMRFDRAAKRWQQALSDAALWAVVRALSFRCVVEAVRSAMRFADAHAVDPSRAGSVPGFREDWAAALKVPKSVYARERARAMSRHCGCPCRTFGTAFVRADLGCTFDPGDDLGCFGSV
jgi:hypothetical protein